MMIVEGSSTIDPWLKNIFNYLGLKRSKKKRKSAEEQCSTMDSPRERFILKRYLFYKHGVDNITSIKRIDEKGSFFFSIYSNLIG